MVSICSLSSLGGTVVFLLAFVSSKVNEKEVAQITGKAVSTLRNERFQRKGLPYRKIGKRSVKYLTQEVISYMEARRITFNENEGV